MPLTNAQKPQIQQVILTCLRNELQKFKAKNGFMPFHFRLLGKDRLALYSFMQSLLTTFGTSIFKPVTVPLAKNNFVKAKAQYIVGNSIYEHCQQNIQNIINQLSIGNAPDKNKEIQMLQESLSGVIVRLKTVKVDLFLFLQSFSVSL